MPMRTACKAYRSKLPHPPSIAPALTAGGVRAAAPTTGRPFFSGIQREHCGTPHPSSRWRQTWASSSRWSRSRSIGPGPRSRRSPSTCRSVKPGRPRRGPSEGRHAACRESAWKRGRMASRADRRTRSSVISQPRSFLRKYARQEWKARLHGTACRSIMPEFGNIDGALWAASSRCSRGARPRASKSPVRRISARGPLRHHIHSDGQGRRDAILEPAFVRVWQTTLRSCTLSACCQGGRPQAGGGRGAGLGVLSANSAITSERRVESAAPAARWPPARSASPRPRRGSPPGRRLRCRRRRACRSSSRPRRPGSRTPAA